MAFAFTYVLLCSDENWYIGSTDDLKRCIKQHEDGECRNTSKRLPVELVYFEGCRSLGAARDRERQLKSGFGRGYLNKRLSYERSCPPS
ncbi:MAG: GIY-YIG nuclease family protein [Kiritimatiellia bacterium]|jgi:putative endonuclease|nr:GIY-YIG nuclease family protein [Kiritimatiellia bacterium]MDP6809539.1 GIY-YIG nuclease family protein [Kiritimatiellia bacterium]MDP7024730.1 GIY-YIG nuclease family protein [Kiritimatiellia bacterium]